MRSIILHAILVVLFMRLTTWFAMAQQDVVVVVEGESPVYHANLVEARACALQDAFVTAVNKILGTLVTAESYTQNFVSIERSVLTKAKGYIKTYAILGETSSPGMVTLKVEVTVSKAPLEHDVDALGILLQAMGHPRVLVAVSGYAGEEAAGSTVAAERKMREVLADKGFHVIEALYAWPCSDNSGRTTSAILWIRT